MMDPPRPPSLHVARRLVAIALVLISCGGPRPTGGGSPPPDAVGATSALTTPGPVTDIRRFEAPGVSFDYPGGWADQTSIASREVRLGRRLVAVLTRGTLICSGDDRAHETPASGACQEASTPGSLRLQISEYMAQLPGLTPPGEPVSIAGYEGAHRDWGDGEVSHALWMIKGPQGSLYLIEAQTPRTDVAVRQLELDALLESLVLDPWQSPAAAVDGVVHVDAPPGFTFDYPEGWSVYYPEDFSTVDSAVVTVASQSVLPPCSTDSCQRFTTPPGAVVVEFRVGGVRGEIDWSRAARMIGGQPALRFGPFGPENATSADEGDHWQVRFGEHRVLTIFISFRGPQLRQSRAAAETILGSIEITEPISES